MTPVKVVEHGVWSLINKSENVQGKSIISKTLYLIVYRKNRAKKSNRLDDAQEPLPNDSMEQNSEIESKRKKESSRELEQVASSPSVTLNDEPESYQTISDFLSQPEVRL